MSVCLPLGTDPPIAQLQGNSGKDIPSPAWGTWEPLRPHLQEAPAEPMPSQICKIGEIGEASSRRISAVTQAGVAGGAGVVDRSGQASADIHSAVTPRPPEGVPAPGEIGRVLFTGQRAGIPFSHAEVRMIAADAGLSVSNLVVVAIHRSLFRVSSVVFASSPPWEPELSVMCR